MMNPFFRHASSYKWTFDNVGGATRVKISTGEDIAHLDQLDKKMWTVLSCPVDGLEIDSKSLAYVDTDGDGKIHIDDVVRTAKWITATLKDSDLLIHGRDSVRLSEINAEDGQGAKILKCAQKVLENLGKQTDEISLADIADSAAIFAKTRFNGDGIITEATPEDQMQKAAVAAAIATVGSLTDRSGAQGVDAALIEKFYAELAAYSAWNDAAVEPPFGDATDSVATAYEALDIKVKDFFMRSRLAAFAPEGTAALDVQTSRIEAISAENLTGKTGEIAAYPVARISAKAEIPADEPINPAWAAQFAIIRSVTGENPVTEELWAEIGARIGAYQAWKNSGAGACVSSLGIDKVRQLLADDCKPALLALTAEDAALKEEAESIELVDKFLHVCRDFYTLLKNFVTFQDFYDRHGKNAIFQVGTLIIDQRACHLCMDASDAAKHAAMAPASGMFLVYCDCSSKLRPQVLHIVAAITSGEVGELAVGKNAIFYDNQGRDWDAVITKVIENPIGVGQAFWSPYRRAATAVENLINKSAAEKDAKMMTQINSKIDAAPGALAASQEAGAEAAPAQKPPFDIAKFAGIFAAIGMALGMIGTALASIAAGLADLKWWQGILVVVGIMLLISGPSMVLAWLKLRRRNIAPLLNANGWAVNASSKISIPFGATLTDTPNFPKIKLKDPYKKNTPSWVKWLITILCLSVVAVGLWLGGLLKSFGLPSPLIKSEPVEAVEDAPAEDAPAEATSAE